MKTLRLAALLSLPLALAACANQGAAEFQDAAPSYASMAMDLDTAATAGGSAGLAPMGATATAPQAASAADAGSAAILDPACHPHLFLRAEGLALRVNRHMWKFLRHVELLSLRHPDRLAMGHASWHRQHGSVEVQWTITRVSDQVFTWLLEMRPVGGTTWTTVFSGQIDRTGATGRHQGRGDARLDLTAMHSVDPSEPATGVITAAFESFADHRQMIVNAIDVVWDPSGDPAAGALGSTPRNAHYVYYHRVGTGGSFKAHDEMVFLCPANTGLLPSDVKAVARWYRTTAGPVNGRSDALMVGGQLPATDKVEGVVCHSGSADGQPQVENYWLMKEEGPTSPQAWGPVGDPASCDAVFGPVPLPDSTANDFDFASLNFDDDVPASFPGGP